MNAKNRKQSLLNLAMASPRVLAMARELESSVPGISDAVSQEMLDMVRAVENNAPPITILARWDNLVSRLNYARRGLYSRVDGNAWRYA